METRGPRPSPQILLSDDDGGLWMKMDSDHVSSHTESTSAASGEKSQDESTVISAAPTSMVRYYSVMDDEGADDVFIPQPPPPPPPPPPPSCTATLLLAEESTGATASNSGVTPSVDATEAEVNPRGLDLSHSEEQLMAARNKVDEEVTASAAQMSMDKLLASDERDSPPPTYQDQKPMDVTGCLMETGHDATGRPYRNIATENEQPEDIVILSEGKENCWETNTEKDNYPKQLHANHKESSEYETRSDKEGDETKHKDVCGFDETDSKLLRENLDIESVETNASIDDDFELCKCNQNRTNTATHQPQVADFQADVAKENEPYDGHASLDCNLVKYDWVRRESGSTEMQVPPLPSSKSSEEMVTMGEQEDGSRRIATDIQQGENLLHRLQLVQLRHDVQMSENPHTQEQAVTRDEEKGMFGTEIRTLTGEEEREESRFETLKKEDAKVSLVKKENNEDEDIQTKARTSSSTIPGEPEHQRIAKLEPGDSDDNQSDSWVPPDLFPLNSCETTSTEIPFLSTGHRFSAAETSMERQLHEAAQGKQKLQRAGGVFNLAENPDVLEIPFKTNVSLESLPTKVGVSEWQFSEQKMHKEISQDIQRELVLVNQGKIPGGYSKGELRQLKETKLLFEAFQQDNPEGPTRYRKSPTTLRKGHIYPSVLERTRSLEMFSLKTCPVSRAHSLRLYQPATAEKEKSPDCFRSKSPTGGSRDKTRLSPYPKQDKHVRLCRSMDSISNDVSTLAVDTKGKAKEANTNKESSILKQNPFFKLRPALALQPDVEKDIREAKEREEELRRQRRTLYGEKRQNSEDEEKSRSTQMLMQDVRKQSRGKLERVWPPPSKKEQMKLEHTEQEPKVHRAGGQKASLWQRWESGLINGKPSKEKK